MEPTTTPTINNKSSMGGVIGTIIIIALIVLGGLYFWGKHVKDSKPLDETSEESAQMTVPTEAEELNTMDADLQSTDLDTLDAELQTEVQ